MLTDEQSLQQELLAHESAERLLRYLEQRALESFEGYSHARDLMATFLARLEESYQANTQVAYQSRGAIEATTSTPAQHAPPGPGPGQSGGPYPLQPLPQNHQSTTVAMRSSGEPGSTTVDTSNYGAHRGYRAY